MYFNVNLGIYISCTVVFWGAAYSANKYCLQTYSSGSLALLRYVIACLFFMFLLSIKLIKINQRPKPKDYPIFLLLGFTGISSYNYCLYEGQHFVMPGIASLLVNTAPVFTSLLSTIFLKEKINGWGYLGILVSFTGLLLVVLSQNGPIHFTTGSFWILVAALSLSTFFVLQKPLLSNYSAIEVIFFSMLGGVVWLLPFSFDAIKESTTSSLNATGVLLFLGIFPGALAYYTWTLVVHQLPAGRASVFLFLIPLFSFALSFVLYGEKPTLSTLIGGIMILTGIFFNNYFAKNN